MGRGAPAVLLQELPDVLLKKKPPKKQTPDDTVASLRAALAALDTGDDRLAIAALVDAWRVRRSPAIAELVDLLDLRQPRRAFDGLIATKADTTRKRLAQADAHDPRVSAVLLDLLEHPKFLTDTALWQQIALKVRDAADPRLLAPYPKLRSILYTQLSPAKLRDNATRTFDALVAQIRAPRDPSPEEAALEHELASRLRGAKSRRDSEDEILREIYDDPLSDGPRLVYADLLSERGDPRGELITLQFARRDGKADESQKARERWLLKKHMKEWLGGLAPAVSNIQSYSQTTFERGFVAIADIYNSAEKKLPLTWGDPGWATVEELRGPYQHVILEKAPLRGLRRLTEGIGVGDLRKLARMPEKVRHLEQLALAHPGELGGDERELISACESLPALRDLEILFYGELQVAEVVWLATEAAVASRLARIVVATDLTPPDRFAQAHATIDAIGDALARTPGRVPVLGIVPPWRSWPRPAPIEFRRGADGKYARVG